MDLAPEFAESVRQSFRIREDEAFDLDVWMRKALVMWLIQDHGQVNVLGHGDPTTVGFLRLPVNPHEIVGKRVRPKKINEVVSLLHVTKDEDEPASWLVMVKLRHAMNDTIFFSATRTRGVVRIRSFFWTIE